MTRTYVAHWGLLSEMQIELLGYSIVEARVASVRKVTLENSDICGQTSSHNSQSRIFNQNHPDFAHLCKTGNHWSDIFYFFNEVAFEDRHLSCNSKWVKLWVMLCSVALCTVFTPQNLHYWILKTNSFSITQGLRQAPTGHYTILFLNSE